jgi:hypothetical protein
MMASTAELIALGNDADFRARVRALFYLEAGVVYAEDPGTANHAARALFASKIVNNTIDAGSLAPALAQRTNLSSETVTYNFDDQRVETSATDAEIRSQIATDWNMFAGV